MSNQRLADTAVYAWAALLIVCLAVGYPIFLGLFLLFPRWHRRRVAKREARQRAASRAALIKGWNR